MPPEDNEPDYYDEQLTKLFGTTGDLSKRLAKLTERVKDLEILAREPAHCDRN